MIYLIMTHVWNETNTKLSTYKFYNNQPVTNFNNNNFNNNPSMVKPVRIYANAEQLKSQILIDNKNKSGIYRWTNNLNGKTYVGSGVDLAKRLRSYFNEKELNRNPRPILDALLKYGQNSFTLEILEYTSREEVIEREQFYLNLLVPEYNVLNYAYSLLGFKHSQETLEKLKSKVISAEHKDLLSSVHKGKTVSSETKDKLSIATSNYRRDNPLTPEALLNIKNKTIAREGVSVWVLNNKTNEVRNFTNQTEAGEYLGVTRQAVYNAIKRHSFINEIYTVSPLRWKIIKKPCQKKK